MGGSMNVSALPILNLSNVPEALRQIANRMEMGDLTVKNCVICWTQEDGEPDYSALGPDPFPVMNAIGLIESVKFMMMNG